MLWIRKYRIGRYGVNYSLAMHIIRNTKYSIFICLLCFYCSCTPDKANYSLIMTDSPLKGQVKKTISIFSQHQNSFDVNKEIEEYDLQNKKVSIISYHDTTLLRTGHLKYKKNGTISESIDSCYYGFPKEVKHVYDSTGEEQIYFDGDQCYFTSVEFNASREIISRKVTSHFYPGEEIDEYTYNSNSSKKTAIHTTNENKKTVTEYDIHEKITTEMSYNRLGIMTSLKTFEHDTMGEITEVAWYNWCHLLKWKESCKYDANGNYLGGIIYDLEKNTKTIIWVVYQFDNVGNWTSKTTYTNGTQTSIKNRIIVYY